MGGRGSGRKPSKPKVKIVRPDKHCENCGKRISPGRNGRRVYCNVACRVAAHRKRNKAVAI